jgi:hypothetical protein
MIRWGVIHDTIEVLKHGREDWCCNEPFENMSTGGMLQEKKVNNKTINGGKARFEGHIAAWA